MIVLASNTKKT